MSYYDPYDLVVGVVAAALETACKTNVLEGDDSRVDIVETYDLSGNPTKPGVTANKIVVSPDTDIGPGRGDYPVTHAIGLGAYRWAYHVAVDIETFPIKVTRDRAEVRDIMSKISGRVRQAVQALARSGFNDTTDDGHWSFSMGAEKLIQGSGMEIKDAGSLKSIKGRQRLIAGFILQYTP